MYFPSYNLYFILRHYSLMSDFFLNLMKTGYQKKGWCENLFLDLYPYSFANQQTQQTKVRRKTDKREKKNRIRTKQEETQKS